MAGRPVRNPSVWGAISRSERAICEKSGRTSSTAITIATQITAKAPSCFSKVSQEHHEPFTAQITGSFGLNRRFAAVCGQPDFNRFEDITMRAHNNSSHTPDRMDSVFASADSATSEPRSASIHLLSSSARAGQHQRVVRSTRAPPTVRHEMAELLADIDGLPILVRLLFKDIPAKMQSDFISKGADIHSLLASTLEKMVDRMRGSSLQGDSRRPIAIVELISNGEPLDRWSSISWIELRSVATVRSTCAHASFGCSDT
jgi:hypothetical protein